MRQDLRGLIKVIMEETRERERSGNETSQPVPTAGLLPSLCKPMLPPHGLLVCIQPHNSTLHLQIMRNPHPIPFRRAGMLCSISRQQTDFKCNRNRKALASHSDASIALLGQSIEPKFTTSTFIFKSSFHMSLSCKMWEKSLLGHFHMFFK